MRRRNSIIPALVIVFIGLFFFLTFREGHGWGDDFAMYLLHAQNIAAGTDYSTTGYVYNPAEATLGPPAYPPVLPLLLAPIYKFAGLNFTLLKLPILATFMGFLAVLYLVSRSYLEFPWRVLLVVLVGLQPYFWVLKDYLNSDVPFLFFSYLVIFLVERTYRISGKQAPPLRYALMVAPAMYLACGTRNVGLALIPALVLYDFMKLRRLSYFALASCTIAGALAVAQGLLLKTAGGYTGMFRLSPGLWVSNSVSFLRGMRAFWLNGYSHWLSYFIYAVVLGLVAVGCSRQIRRGVHFTEIFVLMYLPVIIAFSAPDIVRYLLPVLPLFFIYLLLGLQTALDTSGSGLRPVIAVAAVLLVLMSYVGMYIKSGWGPFREGIRDPDFIALCGFVTTHTGAGDVVMFRKPRLLTLLTGRPAGMYPRSENTDQIAAFARKVHVRYFVLADLPDEEFESEARCLRPFLEKLKPQLVYANPHYRLYVAPAAF